LEIALPWLQAAHLPLQKEFRFFLRRFAETPYNFLSLDFDATGPLLNNKRMRGRLSRNVLTLSMSLSSLDFNLNRKDL